MIKVSTTGMVVSLITDLRFPVPGQQRHGRRIIHPIFITIYKSLKSFTLIIFKANVFKNKYIENPNIKKYRHTKEVAIGILIAISLLYLFTLLIFF